MHGSDIGIYEVELIRKWNEPEKKVRDTEASELPKPGSWLQQEKKRQYGRKKLIQAKNTYVIFVDLLSVRACKYFRYEIYSFERRKSKILSSFFQSTGREMWFEISKILNKKSSDSSKLQRNTRNNHTRAAFNSDWMIESFTHLPVPLMEFIIF